VKLEIVWWDVPDGALEPLRADLSDDVLRVWGEVPGLRLKLWFSDPASGRWGAAMLWDPDRPASPLPSNRALDLIGRPPSGRLGVVVEASVTGTSVTGTSVTGPRTEAA